MSKETDLAYIAGLFDGEGTVSLAVSSNRNAFRRVEVTLSSTDKCLCEFMVSTLECGHVYPKQSRGKAHWKQAYEFRISGKMALTALRAMRPFLRCPKKMARADIIISRFDLVTRRNGKYTQAEREAKAAFEADFFAA